MASPDSSRPRSTSPRRLKIRLNRAQRLRLEDQEARATPAEQLRHPAYLEKIEARIDFGQDGWHTGNSRATQAAEKDRDTQLNMWNVEETDYEPDLNFSEEYRRSRDNVRATWVQVHTGAALNASFVLPEISPTSVRVYWSSDPDDCPLERMELISHVVPRVRESAADMGLEFMLKDPKWGVPKYVRDGHSTMKLSTEILESILKDTVGVHFISFLGSKRGARGNLPFEIQQLFFEKVIAPFVQQSRGEESLALLNKWYKLDENVVPPVYLLQNISSNFPDFLFAADHKAIKAATLSWNQEKEQLSPLLTAAIDVIINSKDCINDEYDSETIDCLTKSALELEISRSVHGPTEDTLWIDRILKGLMRTTTDLDGCYIDWKGTK
ncbi:hypothetical protein HDU76_011199, partial [Blyttiomyces sp. JEL0837]